MHSKDKRQTKVEAIPATDVASIIPFLSETAAYEENMAAIDRTIKTEKYHHIIAWGKWLDFTPDSVRNLIEVAILDDAPADAIQKIDGVWLRLRDIVNGSNRNHVDYLAGHTRDGRT